MSRNDPKSETRSRHSMRASRKSSTWTGQLWNRRLRCYMTLSPPLHGHSSFGGAVTGRLSVHEDRAREVCPTDGGLHGEGP